MLQNNIPMQTKPISFSPKRYIFCIQKVPYFIFKTYIFHLRNKGLFNFQGSPKKSTITPTCFGVSFRCRSQNPAALNVLTSFSFLTTQRCSKRDAEFGCRFGL